MSTHRGSSGCFNWSWADGVSTTTVYFHNTCNYTSTINIWWRQGGSDYMRASTVAADGKGSLWHDGRAACGTTARSRASRADPDPSPFAGPPLALHAPMTDGIWRVLARR
ncbi:hypothetical protein [Streptomyces sp. NPDC057910]|uniref:hypothetical protein n=1 Tax=Streptomyces sp. NPDC057910 TaxID=3346278 RepID=UPI0036EB0155